MANLAAAIGMFDGVHIGHCHLLATVCSEAHTRDLIPAAITFSAHPATLLKPDRPVAMLSTLDEKIKLIENGGIKEVIVLDFTPELQSMTSADFIRMLHERHGVKCLVVGFNNRFGSDREHGFADYRRFGLEIGVEVVEATEVAKPDVSSSAIRKLLEEGKVERATAALGRNYTLEGMVTDGRKLGRKIGFPTANLLPTSPNTCIPGPGVYAAYATDSHFPGIRHKAMVNIGTRPTVNSGTDMTIEAHILDFNGNLYGHRLSLEFVNRLRPERRFNSLEELTAALATDAAVTRRLLHCK